MHHTRVEWTDKAAKKLTSAKSIRKVAGSLPLERQHWFRAGLTRPQVEELLSEAEPGAFIVRPSSMAGHYSLSMIPNDGGAGARARVCSMLIVPVPQPKGPAKYKFGQSGVKLFKNVVELVMHHTENSIGSEQAEAATASYVLMSPDLPPGESAEA